MPLIRSIIINFNTYSSLVVQSLRQTATEDRRLNLAGSLVLLFGYFFVPGVLLLPVVIAVGAQASGNLLLFRYAGAVGGFLVAYGYVRAMKIEDEFLSYDTDPIELVTLVSVTASLVSVLRLWVSEPYNGLSVELLAGLETGAGLTLVALVVLSLVKPIVQEFFFRGVLMTHLDCSLGPVGTILTSTAIYAVYLTFTQEPTNVLGNTGLLFVFALQGLLLGVVYQRTKDLRLVAASHLLIDLGIVIGILVGVYG